MIDYIELLNLEEVKKIIEIIRSAKDIKTLKIENIIFENKIYNIEKKDNYIYIKCSDGRELNVKIDLRYEDQSDGYFHKWIERNVDANIQYVLPTKEYFEYSNVISRVTVKDKKDNNIEKISLDNIISDLNGTFVDSEGNIQTYFSFDFSKMSSEKIYFYPDFVFKDNGIVYKRKLLISADGSKLLSFIEDNDYKNRNLELSEAQGFNELLEVKKIEQLLEENKYNFNPITLKLIRKVIKSLHKEAKLENGIISVYENIIPECKKAVELKKYYFDILNKFKYSTCELNFLIDVVEKEINEINLEKDTHIEQAKTLIKSLSKQQQEALRCVLK